MRLDHCLVLASLVACASPGADSPPNGVEQVVPRGSIPAVIDPVYIGAAAARLPPDAWVLGVVLDGEVRAYSLNLLNAHEVVNDRAGETAFAVVW